MVSLEQGFSVQKLLISGQDVAEAANAVEGMWWAERRYSRRII